MQSFAWSRRAVLAASIGITAAAPAAAETTIMVSPVDHIYYEAPGSSEFVTSPTFRGIAAVGRFGDSPSLFEGDYASTLEFLIPTVPLDATIMGLTLTLHPGPQTDGNDNAGLGDVQFRSYVAPNTINDPSRLYAGNNLTNSLDLNARLVTADLLHGPLAGPTVNYVYDDPGQYLGFAFRETRRKNDCTFCTSFTSLDVAGVFDAVLTITYDVTVPPPPPPPSGTPEPAVWAMLVGGFGLVGVALRRTSRRKHCSA